MSLGELTRGGHRVSVVELSRSRCCCRPVTKRVELARFRQKLTVKWTAGTRCDRSIFWPTKSHVLFSQPLGTAEIAEAMPEQRVLHDVCVALVLGFVAFLSACFLAAPPMRPWSSIRVFRSRIA